MKTARQNKWVETLALGNRSKPDLFLSPEEVLGAPHAAAMRIGFNKLKLAGFFCVDSIPTIAFLTQDRLNRFQIDITHKALWNQGLVSLLLVILPEEVRAYSLLQTPKPEDAADETDDIRDKRLIRSFNLAADAIEISHLITGIESGRYFQENRSNFDQKKKVDAELLSNLRETERRLIGLSPEAAQALLLQIAFIAYLEDRDIIDHEYFEQAIGRKEEIGCLKDLLRSQHPAHLNMLFKKLRQDFNGDIFFAPCAFDESAPAPPLTAEHLQHLADFREGNVELATGQGRFWPYDFRYIPVELISAIYNRFLSEKPKERRASGAYYTPHFLADLTVNQIWDGLPIEIRSKPDFRALDPACGSAIFLVRLFQRMTEDWRSRNPNATPDWDTLVSIVKRLHGWDKETSAVRIGIFSLYIALLEEVEPAAILKLLAEGKLLPLLFRKTMCDRDFFIENTTEEKFDIVVGNPPWVSRKKEKVSSALTWCAARNLPMPSDELAWAFVWKGLHHVKPDGTIAFLLPAMGFLHNHSESSIQARNLWLKKIFLKKVINLSDMRFLLFDGAVRPTALCLFQPSVKELPDYRFDCWCPKADHLLQTTRMLTLNRGDKVSLKISTVLNDPAVWGRHLWMTGRDMKLLGWLSGLSKLDKNLSKYNENKKRGKPWIIGQGFQPVTKASDKPRESKYLNKLQFLDANNFPEWVIPHAKLSDPWNTSTVRRLGFEAGFLGPHVLIPKGILIKNSLLRAAYSEEDFCFRHAIQAISFPQENSSKLKLLTAIINSRFSSWFYFHETASFGSERPLVDENQLLLLPFPDIDELPDPEAARDAQNAIVEIMDGLLRDKDKYSQGQFPDVETVEKLNQLVYQYYGFTEAEITIIEDTIKYILPSIQPRAKKIPPLWEKAGRKHCQEYVTTLTATLTDWLKPRNYLSATLISDHPDLAVVGLKIQTAPPKQSFTITETAQAFKAALTSINSGLKRQISPNFHLIPDLRIFIDDTLYLIKPKALRYWLKSAALNDADAVIADLQSLRYRGHKDKNW